jgi:molybdopterin-binding protein
VESCGCGTNPSSLEEVIMKVSARNVFLGTVAVITLGSAKNLGLKQGGQAYALFKASSVIVGVK